MHLKINIPNDCNLFKANIRALGDSNIFRNRRLNIITAITYYAAIVFIFLMTMALGFYVNPRLYSVFFFGIDMITNILFLVVLGYRCQDYGIHRYIGILCVVIISSIIMLYCGGDFFVSPSNYILAVSDTTISLNKPFFFVVMNRMIFLLLSYKYYNFLQKQPSDPCPACVPYRHNGRKHLRSGSGEAPSPWRLLRPPDFRRHLHGQNRAALPVR